MSGFRLSSLLRVRRLQEDIAAGESGGARVRATAAHRTAAERHRDLALHTFDHQVDAGSFHAAVAARSARSSLYVESAAFASRADAEAEVARAAWQARHREVLPLERLEERHDEAAAQEELAAEQLVLDERATTGFSSRPRSADGESDLDLPADETDR